MPIEYATVSAASAVAGIWGIGELAAWAMHMWAEALTAMQGLW